MWKEDRIMSSWLRQQITVVPHFLFLPKYSKISSISNTARLETASDPRKEDSLKGTAEAWNFEVTVEFTSVFRFSQGNFFFTSLQQKRKMDLPLPLLSLELLHIAYQRWPSPSWHALSLDPSHCTTVIKNYMADMNFAPHNNSRRFTAAFCYTGQLDHLLIVFLYNAAFHSLH